MRSSRTTPPSRVCPIPARARMLSLQRTLRLMMSRAVSASKILSGCLLCLRLAPTTRSTPPCIQVHTALPTHTQPPQKRLLPRPRHRCPLLPVHMLTPRPVSHITRCRSSRLTSRCSWLTTGHVQGSVDAFRCDSMRRCSSRILICTLSRSSPGSMGGRGGSDGGLDFMDTVGVKGPNELLQRDPQETTEGGKQAHAETWKHKK